jgi:nitrogen fixation NifU-like protein
MYAENILDHYRNPRNFGKIPDAQIKNREYNPLCGDDYEFHLKLQDGIVVDAKFSGDGCAISKASASLLSEHIKKKSLEEIKKMKLADIVKLLGIEVSTARIKCALLPLIAIQKGIQNFERDGKDGT